MSTPAEHSKEEKDHFTPPRSPAKGHHHQRLVPSPIVTRRTRTLSQSRLASDSPIQQGSITHFCRNKGHGFVKPEGQTKEIFFHISDIEDEHVVKEGDLVEFRTIPLPPKNVERQAVEIRILKMEGPHQRWDNKPDL